MARLVKAKTKVDYKTLGAMVSGVTPAFNIGDYTAGDFFIPTSGHAGTTITFTAADTEGGTYSLVHTTGSTALSVTVTANTGKWYPLPAQLFSHEWVKINSNGGSDTATIGLHLKG